MRCVEHGAPPCETGDIRNGGRGVELPVCYMNVTVHKSIISGTPTLALIAH